MILFRSGYYKVLPAQMLIDIYRIPHPPSTYLEQVEQGQLFSRGNKDVKRCHRSSMLLVIPAVYNAYYERWYVKIYSVE